MVCIGDAGCDCTPGVFRATAGGMPVLVVIESGTGGDQMARKATSPGKPAPTSGQYRPVGGGNEVTVPKGHRLPPSPKPGQKWVNVDPTKNKSGRG